MFKYMYAGIFYLFGLLFATLQGADLCCPEIKNQLAAVNNEIKNQLAVVKNDIQNQLAVVKLDNEMLTDLVKDLRARLGSSFGWPPSKNEMCPPGFTYVSSAARCYKVVYEGHDWYSAGKKCQGLHRGSHLATIRSATENTALKTLIASDIAKNGANIACTPGAKPSFGDVYWTSGQRLIENNCKTPFVWKPSMGKTLSLQFTNWGIGEPNCDYAEFCLHFFGFKYDFIWNDAQCTWKMCPLCEYSP